MNLPFSPASQSCLTNDSTGGGSTSSASKLSTSNTRKPKLVMIDGEGTRVKVAVNVIVIWSLRLVNTSTPSILIDHTFRSKDFSTTGRKSWTSMYMI